MEKYIFNRAKYGTHSLIAKEIGTGKTVLDVGCNKGYLKSLAFENDFYGIDFSIEDIKEAQKNGYIETYVFNLDNEEEIILKKKFDVIVFGDVLEHTLFPEKVLALFVDNYLKSGGKVIISLPNIGNIAIRIKLFFGNFDYTESGILDKTHLHLYTRKTGRNLAKSCDLKILKEGASSNNFGWFIEKIPMLLNLLGFNLIFVCKKEF